MDDNTTLVIVMGMFLTFSLIAMWIGSKNSSDYGGESTTSNASGGSQHSSQPLLWQSTTPDQPLKDNQAIMNVDGVYMIVDIDPIEYQRIVDTVKKEEQF